ncbi:cell division ATP-binding protein FtsE [Amphritea sp. 1_MG-2023]|uniref:cell division ATP-binding protein FtsE n=1 Tax=Amphritea sp. 1_MG-2023 TaxID=3062670 RepID=UPI0026E458A6|nr:cell division ATP-binding protein FtsE [Amphritea sp. 1_MG-2023]MDO6564727.1 cell division ATP-binding protein FtsE [Amphritea sp. 1_MG-2023]
MISFDNVTKRYPNGYDALSQVNFSLARGEMAFLTGHSGAGKSTLLKLLMLMERPSNGRVLMGDQDLARLSNRQIPYHRRRVGVVFQNHQLLFDRSVFENIVLPLRICGFDPVDAARRARAALDKVGLLDKEKLNPVVLSGGEQQRVGIARAIVHKPQVLLADEPTGNLDPKLSEEVMRLFQQFNQVGTTVLIASHDLSLIARMPHRVITLNQGRLMTDGK